MDIFIPADGHHHELACPRCGSTHGLHHSSVDVYERLEDQQDGLFVSVQGHSLTARPVLPPGNPSDRREGVVIGFWCELCQMTAELCLAQHKGQELLSWRNIQVQVDAS